MYEKSKKNFLTRFLTLLKKCILQEPALFILELIVVILETINNILTILFPKYILRSLNESNLELFVFFLFFFLGIRFIVTNLMIYIEPSISKKKEHLNSIVINEFLTKSRNTKLEKFDESGFYNLYLLTFNKCCDIFQGVLDISVQVLKSLLTIFLTILILSWMNPWFFVCMCCFVLIQTLLSNKIKKLGYIYNKKNIEHNKQLNYLYRLFYIPEYMRDLRINSVFDLIFNKKDKEVQEVINLTYTSKKQIANISIFSTIISFIELILVNGYLGYMVFNGTIWIDMLIASQNSYTQLEAAISSILESFTKMYENDLYVKDYLLYMTDNSEVISGDIQIKSSDIQTITFNNVFFRILIRMYMR